MANIVGTSMAEAQSKNKSPLLNDTNYNYWIAKMRIYIQATFYELWICIVNGPNIPTKMIDGVPTPKEEK